jgi:light-regulated signal transduction histidine kinase (bacteriophytochrome)
LHPQEIDLARIADEIAHELRQSFPGAHAEIVIQPALKAAADPNLMRIALSNLLHNAWKFSARSPAPRIEFGRTPTGPQTFYVRDNGAGFDMEFAGKLFQPFQRLHGVTEFEGTGIGLATVARVVARHGGRIWAEAGVGKGATFFFTLAP